MTNKEIKFAFTVDDRSVQQAKRALTEILSLTERIARSMNGMGGAGGAGRGPPMTFLGGMNIGAGRAGGGPSIPGGGSNQANNVFAAQAKGLKDLGKTSGDTAKTMAQDLRKSVEDQKRSLADLDSALETASKRYKELKANQSSLISSLMAAGASPAQAQAYAANQLQNQQDYIDNTRAQRHGVEGQLRDSEKRTKDFYMQAASGVKFPTPPEWGEEKGGGGGQPTSWSRLPMRAKVGAIAGVGLAGGVEAANIMFDAVERPLINRVRQAQAFQTLGVQTISGDLSGAAAAMRLVQSGDQDAKNFMKLSTMNIAQGISGAGGAAGSVLGGNISGVRQLPEKALIVDPDLKERMRRQIDLFQQGDPQWFYNFNKFQSEAAMRQQIMRRTGYGASGVSDLLSHLDSGEALGGFEAMRAGGYRFAQRHLWTGANIARQGLNLGDIGQLLSSAASTMSSIGPAFPGGPTGVQEMLRSIRVGLDPAAVEALAKGVAVGIQSGLFGATSGMGLIETMRFGMGSMSDEAQTRTMRARMSALPAVAGMLSGGDGMGSAINILTANRLTGKGADIYQTNALLHLMADPATLADAASGRPNAALQAQGITPEMARRMVADTTAWRMRAQYFPQAGARLTPASLRAKQLDENFGGDIKNMFGALPQSERGRAMTELGAALTAQSMFKSQDEAEAYISYVAGLNSGRVGKGKFKGGDPSGKTAEGKYVTETRFTAEESYRKFMEENGTFVETVIGAAPKMAETFLNMGRIGVSASEAAKALEAMTIAADNFTKKYGVPRAPSKKDQEKLGEEARAAQHTGKVVPSDMPGDTSMGVGGGIHPVPFELPAKYRAKP